MTTARLAAGIWVSAYLARLGFANIPAYITRRGDETAGAIMVKCATLDGRASLWSREWDFDSDTRPWTLQHEGPEADIDAAARKQAGFDPDLWLIEIESRTGQTLLDQDGLG